MRFGGPFEKVRIALTLVVGPATIGYGAYSYTAPSSALDLPDTVEATISSVFGEKSAGKGDTFTPQATFSYTYGGESYTSSNVYPGGLPREFGSREQAWDQLEGWNLGPP